MNPRQHYRQAFTLIELSIVLVIVGLLAGGILVGRDLISAAAVRAQISQIQKYQQAVNTFRGKYNALPGDMDGGTAAQFGFLPRDIYRGTGDGNGLLEGGNALGYKGIVQGYGETAVFWVDLSYANGMNLNLISGRFSMASFAGSAAAFATNPSLMIPPAEIGNGNYVYVYSPGYCCAWVNTSAVNYFGLSKFVAFNGGGDLTTTNGLTVSQAYNMDKKVDDGFPLQGNVIARYATTNDGLRSATSASLPDSTTCYDTTSGQYSITQNNGAGINCALSFKFQ